MRLNPYTVHLLSAETQQVLRQSSQLLQIIDDEEGQLGAGQKQDQELVQVPPAGLRRRSGGDVGAEVALKPTAATAGGRRKRDHP